MPIKQPGVKSRARKVTAEEKKFSAFATLRKVSYFATKNVKCFTDFVALLETCSSNMVIQQGSARCYVSERILI